MFGRNTRAYTVQIYLQVIIARAHVITIYDSYNVEWNVNLEAFTVDFGVFQLH